MGSGRPKVRRITRSDNATTLPGRVTFPVGTFVNPSTAAAGALGGPAGNQPGKPPTQEELLNQQRLTYEALMNNGKPNPNYTNLNFGNPMPQVTSSSPVVSKAVTPGVNAPPVGQGGNIPATSPKTNLPLNTGYAQQAQNPELGLANRSPDLVRYMEDTKKLPNYLTPQDLTYMQNQGLDTAQLSQFYTFDAKTQSYKLNDQGAVVNSGAGVPGGALKPNQYIDANGNVKYGAKPYGTNAAGQRLDASGNVWDPKTATRDIYGGQFIQVGEERWERNKRGRLVKVRYGKGGKKTVVKGGPKKGGGGGESQARQTPQQPEPEKPKPGQQTSTSFNAAVG